MNDIILASSSPRRIQMMKGHGYCPVVMPADVDETLPEDIAATDAVMYLALKKALFVEDKLLKASNSNAGKIIIAADTVVHLDKILGKPVDRSDARQMLNSISGKSHFVSTGVAIIKAGEPQRNVFCDTTKVFCKILTPIQIEDYLDTDEPYDKAGAYAIQGEFSKYIDHYEGSYDTVVGFPIELVKEKLLSF